MLLQKINQQFVKFGAFSVCIALLLFNAPKSSLAVEPSSKTAIRQIYSFGDSLSDPGNSFALTTGLPGGPVPPSPPYFEGHFSNTLSWVELLSKRLGLNPIKSTDIKAKRVRRFSNGINFSLGGSNSDNTNALPFPTLYGLEQQITQFIELKNTGLSYPRQSLFTLWIGANDYINAIAPESKSFQDMVNHPVLFRTPTPRNDSRHTNPVVLSTISNIDKALTQLVGAGAKHILVSNLPDLGKIPLGNRNLAVSALLTNLSTQHNLALNRKIEKLNQKYPFAKFAVLDVNHLFNDAIANPSKYQFINVTDSCLTFTGTTPMICSNPDAYLFWDQLHPTKPATIRIANLAFREVYKF